MLLNKIICNNNIIVDVSGLKNVSGYKNVSGPMLGQIKFCKQNHIIINNYYEIYPIMWK